MARQDTTATRRLREDVALRLVVEGTASATGVEFFRALVKNLCLAIDTAGAWITELQPGGRRMRSLAFWLNGEYVERYEYELAGTPCQPVIEQRAAAHFPDRVIELFPADPDLPGLNAVSYMGLPMHDVDGELLGHLAILDTKPMPPEPRLLDIIGLFAERAAAEYRRLRSQQRAEARQEQLDRLIDSAMDAIVVLDDGLEVVRANPAAVRIFDRPLDELVGAPLTALLDPKSSELVARRAGQLAVDHGPERQHWFPDELGGLRRDGSRFPAEATLSCFTVADRVLHTVILRSVDERRRFERRIRALSDEAEYLREMVRETTGDDDDLIGDSPVMRRLLDDMNRVASTDATVLVHGETGTGKELVARRIHQASRRRDGRLVRVNCAAIPSSLMESEFFGHERGAFTGATGRREGRFSLADGGSILLDEIGELPLDLQAKLLRVLQEGEFEKLGGSTTERVDVRVIAATNRKLGGMVEQGRFREDLYYRLNVFPIEVPPLRERGGDIGRLAGFFAERFARRMGRRVDPLTDDDRRRLERYPWPGNVRELQNVIERAIILSSGRRIEVVRALPTASGTPEAASAAAAPPPEILTRDELLDLERDNLIRALEACDGRIAGPDGAAARLGVPESTVRSRMKALGIARAR